MACNHKLGLIELRILQGLLFNKSKSYISTKEIELLNNIIAGKNIEIIELLGLNTLPSYNSYYQIILANKMAIDSVADAVFLIASLENVCHQQNKDIALSALKTAFNAVSVALALTSAFGVGGVGLALLPSAIDVFDKTTNVVYAHCNSDAIVHKKHGASVNAIEQSSNLQSSSNNLTTLYNISKFNAKAKPEEMLAARSKMVQYFSRNRRYFEQVNQNRAVIINNNFEIQSLINANNIIKEKLDKLSNNYISSTRHKIRSQELKNKLQAELDSNTQLIKDYYEYNSELIYLVLDLENTSLSYFDSSAYKALIKPLVDIFHNGVHSCNAPKQVVDQLDSYLESINVLNITLIKDNLLKIIKRSNFSSCSKLTHAIKQAAIKSESLLNKVKSDIKFYQGHISRNEYPMKVFKPECILYNNDSLDQLDEQSAHVKANSP